MLVSFRSWMAPTVLLSRLKQYYYAGKPGMLDFTVDPTTLHPFVLLPP